MCVCVCVCVCVFPLCCLPVEKLDCMMYVVFHNVDFADYFPSVPFNMFLFSSMFSGSCQVGTVSLMEFMSDLCPFHCSSLCGPSPLSRLSCHMDVLAAVDVLLAVFSHLVRLFPTPWAIAL